MENIAGYNWLCRHALRHVRILGPVRDRTQVELSLTDAIHLGIRDLPTRLSGDLAGAAPITIVGPAGSLYLPEAAIRARRHIHVGPGYAKRHGVRHGSLIHLHIGGPGTEGVTYHNIVVRVKDGWTPVVHLDTDEFNAFGGYDDTSSYVFGYIIGVRNER